MHDILWRAAPPELKAGRYRSVIQENKDLRLAVADTEGDYFFSDVGAGVYPLAFVGTLPQVATFLAENAHHRIVNTVRERPHVYAGMDLFKPNAPFNGGLSLAHLVQRMVGDKGSLEAVDKQDERRSKVYILRVSYLPEDGLTQVATRELRFGDLLAKSG